MLIRGNVSIETALFHIIPKYLFSFPEYFGGGSSGDAPQQSQAGEDVQNVRTHSIVYILPNTNPPFITSRPLPLSGAGESS
jgi:hypothetical protein